MLYETFPEPANKTSWQKGKTNYIDDRVKAGRGLKRKMNKGNAQAELTYVSEFPTK